MSKQEIVVLMAEDNDHDIVAARRAWEKLEIATQLFIVSNGEICLDYLQGKGKFRDTERYPRPGLLLLDINLPKINGLKVLERIRKNPNLKGLPVVMITTSKREEDKAISSGLGIDGFIIKSLEFDEFVESMKAIKTMLEEMES
ncbi:response regulator [Maridesulfovibrio sp.]|uniref:response regulator n=1 Tax=Maridesulfovibrio sp. TaxID=2795000 RepID=UPI003BA8DFD4